MPARRIKLRPAATGRPEKNASRDAAVRTKARSRHSHSSARKPWPQRICWGFSICSRARALSAKDVPSDVSTQDSWNGTHGHRADGAFAEVFSLDSEGVIEAGTIVFPCDRGSKFD